MSQIKRWMEEQEARGFSEVEGQVCASHFKDYALISFINRKGKPGNCDYCDKNNSNVVAFNDLMEVIVDGIRNHFGSPEDESVPYSSEFGYWSKTYDTDDLIRWIIELDADDDVLTQIVDSIGFDNLWCHKSPESPRPSEFMNFDWNLFSKMLKHKMRYVFYKYPKKIKTEYGKVDPSTILDKIGKAIIGLKLFYKTNAELFTDLRMYRARQHKRTTRVQGCREIGPVSPAKAKSANRFSPPGIPMFYGALKKSTAIKEVINRNEKTQTITTGVFKNIKPLTLVDLTRIPKLSIFDLEFADFYDSALFLRHLAKKISKKVKKDGAQHFDYVPTQVITEYIRHVLPHEAGLKIDGLIYNSSAGKGICYVIFADSRNCKDENDQSKHTSIVLEKNSLERIKVKDVK